MPLTVLGPRFRPLDQYRALQSADYSLLPFRFLPLDDARYVVTNIAGDYVVMQKPVLQALIRRRIAKDSSEYEDLKSQHFLIDGDSLVALDLLAAKYRSRQLNRKNFSSLFMFVTTLRCDHSCPYCQVSRQTEDKRAFDMTPEIANKGIDFMFRTPAPCIKVEFQGGESLLNFEIIKHITERTLERNLTERREIAFVIATNLAPLTDDHLAFCRTHSIALSTSLDGPRELHNKNRPRPERDSYERTIAGIQRAREALGHDRVAALMTTTEASLSQPVEIVDEYVRQQFQSIFMRSLSPYGFAMRTGAASRYSMDEWLAFYRTALAHIIDLNHRGTPIREEYARIILTKMLTHQGVGYVDLQSPAGLGISGLVFNYDGDIYASDEARMLAEDGDKTFRLGNLFSDSYERVMGSEFLVKTLRDTMTEGMPMCSDCGVMPYCGSDPVRHHQLQDDAIGFKPTSDHCRKHMNLIRHLIVLLADDQQASKILRSWV